MAQAFGDIGQAPANQGAHQRPCLGSASRRVEQQQAWRCITEAGQQVAFGIPGCGLPGPHVNVRRADAVTHDHRHAQPPGNLRVVRSPCADAFLGLDHADQIKVGALGLGVRGVLEEHRFIADGRRHLVAAGGEHQRGAAGHEVVQFVVMQALLGIHQRRQPRAQYQHADAHAGHGRHRQADRRRYAEAIARGLQRYQLRRVGGHGQLPGQRWFVAGQGQFGEHQQFGAQGRGLFDGVQMMGDIGGHIAFAQSQLYCAALHGVSVLGMSSAVEDTIDGRSLPVPMCRFHGRKHNDPRRHHTRRLADRSACC
ncbi:hypothetical protein WR25_24245 [Diploscapter pachys]|uniref:Uncharacterized protein n=1 Tax=Diploscapter pachys TaxID=2018661 RepID=A0A2A2JY14_9BILA|nr:hypothetical protein WR25_24245 [Diploscapter pachys]